MSIKQAPKTRRAISWHKQQSLNNPKAQLYACLSVEPLVRFYSSGKLILLLCLIDIRVAFIGVTFTTRTGFIGTFRNKTIQTYNFFCFLYIQHLFDFFRFIRSLLITSSDQVIEGFFSSCRSSALLSLSLSTYTLGVAVAVLVEFEGSRSLSIVA